jgi:hypothetical protein
MTGKRSSAGTASENFFAHKQAFTHIKPCNLDTMSETYITYCFPMPLKQLQRQVAGEQVTGITTCVTGYIPDFAPYFLCPG